MVTPAHSLRRTRVRECEPNKTYGWQRRRQHSCSPASACLVAAHAHMRNVRANQNNNMCPLELATTATTTVDIKCMFLYIYTYKHVSSCLPVPRSRRDCVGVCVGHGCTRVHVPLKMHYKITLRMYRRCVSTNAMLRGSSHFQFELNEWWRALE